MPPFPVIGSPARTHKKTPTPNHSAWTSLSTVGNAGLRPTVPTQRILAPRTSTITGCLGPVNTRFPCSADASVEPLTRPRQPAMIPSQARSGLRFVLPALRGARVCSSVGLECHPVKVEVAGSSPVRPAIPDEQTLLLPSRRVFCELRHRGADSRAVIAPRTRALLCLAPPGSAILLVPRDDLPCHAIHDRASRLAARAGCTCWTVPSLTNATPMSTRAFPGLRPRGTTPSPQVCRHPREVIEDGAPTTVLGGSPPGPHEHTPLGGPQVRRAATGNMSVDACLGCRAAPVRSVCYRDGQQREGAR